MDRNAPEAGPPTRDRILAFLPDGRAPDAHAVELAIREYDMAARIAPPSACDADSIKLFVGNIPKDLNEQQLQQIFEYVGPIVRVSLNRYGSNAKSGSRKSKSKGSAMLWYRHRSHAIDAILAFHGRVRLPGLDGTLCKVLTMRPASRVPLQPPPSTPTTNSTLTRSSHSLVQATASVSSAQLGADWDRALPGELRQGPHAPALPSSPAQLASSQRGSVAGAVPGEGVEDERAAAALACMLSDPDVQSLMSALGRGTQGPGSGVPARAQASVLAHQSADAARGPESSGYGGRQALQTGAQGEPTEAAGLSGGGGADANGLMSRAWIDLPRADAVRSAYGRDGVMGIDSTLWFQQMRDDSRGAGGVPDGDGGTGVGEAPGKWSMNRASRFAGSMAGQGVEEQWCDVARASEVGFVEWPPYTSGVPTSEGRGVGGQERGQGAPAALTPLTECLGDTEEDAVFLRGMGTTVGADGGGWQRPGAAPGADAHTVLPPHWALEGREALQTRSGAAVSDMWLGGQASSESSCSGGFADGHTAMLGGQMAGGGGVRPWCAADVAGRDDPWASVPQSWAEGDSANVTTAVDHLQPGFTGVFAGNGFGVGAVAPHGHPFGGASRPLHAGQLDAAEWEAVEVATWGQPVMPSCSRSHGWPPAYLLPIHEQTASNSCLEPRSVVSMSSGEAMSPDGVARELFSLHPSKPVFASALPGKGEPPPGCHPGTAAVEGDLLPKSGGNRGRRPPSSFSHHGVSMAARTASHTGTAHTDSENVLGSDGQGGLPHRGSQWSVASWDTNSVAQRTHVPDVADAMWGSVQASVSCPPDAQARLNRQLAALGVSNGAAAPDRVLLAVLQGLTRTLERGGVGSHGAQVVPDSGALAEALWARRGPPAGAAGGAAGAAPDGPITPLERYGSGQGGTGGPWPVVASQAPMSSSAGEGDLEAATRCVLQALQDALAPLSTGQQDAQHLRQPPPPPPRHPMHGLRTPSAASGARTFDAVSRPASVAEMGAGAVAPPAGAALASPQPSSCALGSMAPPPVHAGSFTGALDPKRGSGARVAGLATVPAVNTRQSPSPGGPLGRAGRFAAPPPPPPPLGATHPGPPSDMSHLRQSQAEAAARADAAAAADSSSSLAAVLASRRRAGGLTTGAPGGRVGVPTTPQNEVLAAGGDRVEDSKPSLEALLRAASAMAACTPGSRGNGQAGPGSGPHVQEGGAALTRGPAARSEDQMIGYLVNIIQSMSVEKKLTDCIAELGGHAMPPRPRNQGKD